MAGESTVMPQPRPIELPAEFPIEWPDPAMAHAPWQQDRMHVPAPITPMSTWWSTIFARGFSQGLADYSVPMGVSTARLNSYFYMAIAPNVPPEQMAEMGQRSEALIQQALPVFWHRWENEWLPEIQNMWADWGTHDLAGKDDEELKATVARAVELYERIWHIHFELMLPPMIGVSLFQDAYTDLFPDAPPLSAYELLQGFDNVSLEAGRRLRALALRAGDNASLRALIDETSTDQLWERLGTTEEGRAFREQLSDYLHTYGRRSDTVQELADPSWTENPQPALDNLKAYIRDQEDPDETLGRLADERERAVAAAREQIALYPEPVRNQFEGLLAVAQRFTQAQEDHNFWIDQRSLHEIRQLCLELGARLVKRGALASRDDIFLLDMDEALAALAGVGPDTLKVTAARRAEMDHWRTIIPPPFVGTDYGPPPDNPVTRAVGRFWGGPPSAPPTASELRGNPGSAGKVTGTARVILSISDAGRLAKGDILVTPTTSPPWTPYFATAGGIITDTGGVLSHCAIVAREYGIPAVVGAVGATVIITDGATVEVDGDNGLIRVLV